MVNCRANEASELSLMKPFKAWPRHDSGERLLILAVPRCYCSNAAKDQLARQVGECDLRLSGANSGSLVSERASGKYGMESNLVISLK